MLFLAEFYLPASARLSDVVAQARTAAGVEFLQAIFVPTDEVCLALYRAASAADVTAAGRAAGLEFDRVTEALAVV